ncbi:TRAP transporter substrate-binding protein DctP [Rhizobium laguerreae]|uniref:TRAP transporter substrate-binding protein DctP n=1 Tax=Rhizobium laguerreae TaxID=1076926 RepID=UPI001C90DC48|nr:TRAP transporter substrate-binding protein DctP [Rhizobium laguerreae]MBY3217748.1 TRAP transporter substrate-binding protein DctP [Rhizobium laguerreae]
MNRRTLLASASAVATLWSFAPHIARARTNVTITHPSPTSSHFGIGADAFKAEVERASDGRFAINVQRLDNEREAYESVQLGAQEFAIGTTGPLGNFVPLVKVFDIPFLFRDYEHARAVLDGPIGNDVLSGFPVAGLVGLAWGENGFRHLTTGKAQITGPKDVDGLKIRTMENKVHMQAWQAAGVLPTPMAFSELPTALQQGTVDGQENPIPVILVNNFDQLQQHLYRTAHVYSPGIVVGNPAFLEALDSADRAIFDQAAKVAAAANRAKVEGDETSGIAELKRRGMQVHEVDRGAFRAAMAPAMAGFQAEFGEELINAIVATEGNL